VRIRTKEVFLKKSILKHIYNADFGISKVSKILDKGGFL